MSIIKKPGLVVLFVLLVLAIVVLTGCPPEDDEEDPTKIKDSQHLAYLAEQRGYPDAPEGGGLSPTLVEYALLSERINFSAAPERESPNGWYSYRWTASCEPGVEKSDGYGFDAQSQSFNPIGYEPVPFEEQCGRCCIYFVKPGEWRLTIRIIGAYDTDEEVICGEYSAIVKVRSMRIVPSEITNGELGTDYTFTAEAVGAALPAGSYTYKWDIDKEVGNIMDTKLETSTNQMTYAFREGGNYEIMVSVSPGGKELIGKSQVAIADMCLIITAPDESPLVTHRDYTFIAESLFPQYLTENPYYHWDFGDGTGLIVPFFNKVNHAFTEEGQYTIKVDLRESEEDDAPVLASATVGLLIEPAVNHLSELQQMKKFALDFAVQHDNVDGGSYVYLWDYVSYGEVVWNGVNFSMEWEQYNHSERMTGSVSEDGTKILQLNIRHEFKDSSGNLEWSELTIVELPFWTDTMPDRFIVDKSGEDVQNYITYFKTFRTAGYQWTKDARLYVRFEK
ncbi:MAG: PKD domain-containing protein [Dehalococcoidales bacterium]|nr:MAG: PKD domain-containing protein [Dehalococcoidales bacterium]